MSATIIKARDLTQEKLKTLIQYDAETGVLTRLDGLGWKPRTDHDRYPRITLAGTTYYEHRLIWFYMTGEWVIVDHADCDKTNNRWANLRKADKSQNGANRGPTAANTSGLKGVFWHRATGKWAARIKHMYRPYHIGLFDSKEQASAAYAAKAKELFGEFSRSDVAAA